MHNGLIADFPRLRRELALAVDADLFPHILGTTDTEVMFFLALTFGLDQDPVGAVERMVGFVAATAERHGVVDVMQMTLCLSDGERLSPFATPPVASRARSTSARKPSVGRTSVSTPTVSRRGLG
jgi:glutamine amidotransferase